MRRSIDRLKFACAALVLLTAAGCSQYPFYRTSGSPESRVVEVHVDETKVIKVPAGTGIGAGLSADMQMQLATGKPVVIEKEGAKVTVKPGFLIGAVEYDGKPIHYHEPIL